VLKSKKKKVQGWASFEVKITEAESLFITQKTFLMFRLKASLFWAKNFLMKHDFKCFSQTTHFIISERGKDYQ